uniref:Uncharacterized protein n=1 Tax=Anguilla anguilla TaxID=7936 RepID=A0A0E9X2N5_ANGAN
MMDWQSPASCTFAKICAPSVFLRRVWDVSGRAFLCGEWWVGWPQSPWDGIRIQQSVCQQSHCNGGDEETQAQRSETTSPHGSFKDQSQPWNCFSSMATAEAHQGG